MRCLQVLSMIGILLAGGLIAGAAGGGTTAPAAGKYEIATFAGGCFWCMQPAFDDIPGVVSTRAGYTGGHTVDPTYREVCTGMTGHAEAVEVTFDPSKISYRKLLDVFWHNIDPTVKDQQFCDDGNQYRTAIFYHGPEQERDALESKAELEKTKPFKEPIVTEIVPAGPFYPAEEYHQEYCRTHTNAYRAYRTGCGRDVRLRALWGAAAGGH
ncbi:MAG: peptide-methionine (S)-S-oxide reductase MsrA [Candidatus Binataceae bacterium]